MAGPHSSDAGWSPGQNRIATDVQQPQSGRPVDGRTNDTAGVAGAVHKGIGQGRMTTRSPKDKRDSVYQATTNGNETRRREQQAQKDDEKKVGRQRRQ